MNSNLSDFIQLDAERAFEVLADGGIALAPMDIGYSLLGGSREALDTIFTTKGRAATKLNAMVGDNTLANELFDLTPNGRDVLTTITEHYGLPLGAIGPIHTDHPFIEGMDATTRAASTKDNTVVLLMRAGPFHAALSRLSRQHGVPLIGSSANRSNQGTKFRVEDIEPEVLAIADIVIDHGLRKFHMYGASSTLLNVETFEVVRYGVCFEVIADVIDRHFGVKLPQPKDGPVARAMANFDLGNAR